MTINEAKTLETGSNVVCRDSHGSLLFGKVLANDSIRLVGVLNDGRRFAVDYDSHTAAKVLTRWHKR